MERFKGQIRWERLDDAALKSMARIKELRQRLSVHGDALSTGRLDPDREVHGLRKYLGTYAEQLKSGGIVPVVPPTHLRNTVSFAASHFYRDDYKEWLKILNVWNSHVKLYYVSMTLQRENTKKGDTDSLGPAAYAAAVSLTGNPLFQDQVILLEKYQLQLLEVASQDPAFREELLRDLQSIERKQQGLDRIFDGV